MFSGGENTHKTFFYTSNLFNAPQYDTSRAFFCCLTLKLSRKKMKGIVKSQKYLKFNRIFSNEMKIEKRWLKL